MPHGIRTFASHDGLCAGRTTTSTKTSLSKRPPRSGLLSASAQMLAPECNQGRILHYFTSRNDSASFLSCNAFALRGFQRLGHVDRLEAGGLVRLQLADQVHIGGYHRAQQEIADARDGLA